MFKDSRYGRIPRQSQLKDMRVVEIRFVGGVLKPTSSRPVTLPSKPGERHFIDNVLRRFK